MLIALLSDVHGNLPAFEAVLADVASADVEQTWCLGDLVGYGAQPDACVELARSSCDVCLAEDDSVSRHHAELVQDRDAITSILHTGAAKARREARGVRERLRATEEVRITRRRTTRQASQHVTLRREEAVVERLEVAGRGDDDPD